LVDDERLILSTLSSELTRAGYQVNTAESVDEAEIWLKNNDRPDLVILDVRMPGRDGLELTECLDELHQIPFILLTAYSEDKLITQAGASGAIGYLVKPVNVVKLIPAIETALSRAQELQSLRSSKQQLQTALNADRLVSVAVGIVMGQQLINNDEALNLLRKIARSKNLKLVELASNIVNARETLNLINGL
jgi:AmiR/NasT family two-component response regulator